MFLEILQIAQEDTCAEISLIEWQLFRPPALLKRDSNICFPVEFTTFLEAPNLKSANDCF